MSEEITYEEYDSLIREVLASGGEFRIYPHGTSMLPCIRPGIDSVSLKKLTGRAKIHDILFYRRSDGQYVLHRVREVTKGGYTMLGDHQIVTEPGVPDSQIIGVVCRFFREDQEVNLRSFCYWLYCRIWYIRRIRVLFFRRNNKL